MLIGGLAVTNMKEVLGILSMWDSCGPDCTFVLEE